MEKNTLLAIILSLAVLFGYETMFVAPKRAQMLKEAQLVTNKQVEVKSSQTATAATSNTTPSSIPTSSALKEENIEIKTASMGLNATNVGGTLHNFDLSLKNKVLPLVGVLGLQGLDQQEFTRINTGTQQIAYAYTDANWQITKTFTLVDANSIKSRMEIKNVSKISNLEIPKIKLIGIDSSRMDNSNNRETMLDEYSVNTGKKILRKGNAVKFRLKEEKGDVAQVEWAAFRDHYHAVVVKPEFETKSFDIKVLAENKLDILIVPKEAVLAPGQAVAYDFTIYAGPQDIHLMKKYGGHIEKAVAFFNWSFFNWIAIFIYHTIAFLHSIVKSWGMAIILFSALIYGLTYPLTVKSMLSMRRMQEMQPKIAALREKYKNDPQRLNAETIEIYRREKINPLGGCLPFLLQMPIFISVYQVVWRAYYFQGQSFLWIKDLAQPDRLFVLPFTIPFLGNDFNILPLVMGGLMFMQQKLSSKNMVVTDETQVMQQKMMTTIMPIFMAFIFYKFASSLSLYFIMFYLFSTLTQWKMSQKTVK